MTEALALARRGTALAHPNPRVGCVIVKNGRKIGEGFHTYDQIDHAEVIALRQAGDAARGATLYVNLEPCSHTGRTGPCADAIIAAGVRRVVAAMQDPNSEVAGRGFARLRRAGVDVVRGVLESEASTLNEGFSRWIRTELPFVTLKSALSLDGLIAAHPGKPTRITGEAARSAVQELRHEADAVLTGIGTVLADNPLLTDRTGKPRRRKLLRVVLDARLRLPLNSKLVKSADGDVLVCTAQSPNSAKARALARKGVEAVRLPARAGRIDLRAVLRELGRREILNVVIEAGMELNGAALEGRVVDKLVLFYAPKVIGPGGAPMARLRDAKGLPPLWGVTLTACGADFVLQGYFHDVYRNHRSRRKN